MQIITYWLYLCFIIVILISAAGQPGYAQQTREKINAGAVWNPSMDDMENINRKCGLLAGEDLYSCLINEMQSAKASGRAIEFTKLLGGRGYINAFKPLGIADIAFVYYPFNKENHEGCFIVNGNPGLLDVDNYNLLNLGDLDKAPEYIQLKQKYSHISLFPGDRKGTNYPVKENLPNNGERVIINYTLKDGCNKCELIGYVEFGFDFDNAGKFRRTKFLTLKKAVTLDSVLIANSNPRNVFNDPSRPIVLSEGEQFAIVLQSNHSAGIKWELAGSLNEKVVTLLGTNFLIPNETLPNASGKEIWSFKTAGKGATEIKFKYVRDWQGGEKGFQNYTFTLEVN